MNSRKVSEGPNRRRMDLKLVFYVLSLILLIAYGAEARKTNILGKRWNFPLAKVHLPSNGDWQNKDDTQNYNHQQAKTENLQVNKVFRFGDLQNKDDVQKEGENKHEQAKTENASDHVDPSVRVFFLLDDLKVSKELSVSFPRRTWNFLPKDKADSIPFSRKELPNLLQRFAISRNSPQAKTMEETLKACEFPPIKEETNYCATSPEAMLDFVQGIMGEKSQIKTSVHNSFLKFNSPASKIYYFGSSTRSRNS